MSLALTSPVTGAAQTGTTSPTFTLALDGSTPNGYIYSVTAKGGTQTGVDVASATRPFKIRLERPSFFRKLPIVGISGAITGSGKNVWRIRTLKGASTVSGNVASDIVDIDMLIKVPSGADYVDPANVRAALSLHIGCLDQISAALGDSIISGTI